MNTEHFKVKLMERLDELNIRLHDIEDELDAPHAKDFEEMAVQLEGDEVLESLGNQGLIEARQIRAALERIEKGTFGECLECGEGISVERLEILPHTQLCRNCADKSARI